MIRLMLKSVTHRPVRNGTLILSFACIAATLFAGHFLVEGATDSVRQELSRLGADIIVVPEQSYAQGEAVLLTGEPSTFFLDHAVVDQIDHTDGVAQAAPQIYIATLPADCCSSLVQLIAIDPARDFTIAPWLARHRDTPLGEDEIIVGSDIVGDVGSAQYFYGHPFRIVGRLEPTGTGVDVSVFLREEDARAMAVTSGTLADAPVDIPEGKVSVVLVRVQEPSKTKEIADRIGKQVPGVRVITSQHLVNSIASRLDATAGMLDLAALVAVLVAFPLIALISVMAAHERRREIGILRALGATGLRIFYLVIGESVIISLAGGLLGIISATTVLVLFQSYLSVTLGVPLTVPPVGSLVTSATAILLLTTGIGGAAALVPAAGAAGMEPYRAIRSGES